MLANVNPETIKDLASARVTIQLLLNLVEELSSANQGLREEVQGLRDEVNRLKGEQGKPSIKPSAKPEQNHSSEQERRVPKAWQKRPKRAKLVIHREEKLMVDKSQLPADAEFKGYEEVVVQDIRITPNNTCFVKEKYYSLATGKSYLAPMPPGYEGEFGPGVRALIITLYHSSGMTEPKIGEFLRQFEISISAGQISNLLVKALAPWHAEKADVRDAGLASTPWQHSDDTGTRVNGVNYHCHILCNPYYTAYFTRPYKNRLTIIHLLQGREELQLLCNGLTGVWFDEFTIPLWARESVAQWPQGLLLTSAELAALVQRDLSRLNDQQQARIWEAAALTAYYAQTDTPRVDILLTDDAPQFGQITPFHALCWVHEGRHYKKLLPVVPYHRQLLDTFLNDFWSFYRELLAYRQEPQLLEAAHLRTRFDELFSTTTGYHELDQRIAKTKLKAENLLVVLDFPDLPLHNNPAELGARQRVRKRKISLGPTTQEGLEAWDTFMTLAETAKKLGVNFFAYVFDRVSQSYRLPSLAHLITERVALPST